MENTVELKVYGKYALFTDPITKIGGEKYSYQIPTYQSLKGILESVYWKPTIIWVIDKLRVIKPIKTQTRSAKPLSYTKGNYDLSIYTYLSEVEYQVQAHFEWNYNRPDMEADRNENKHYFVAKRMIEKGGRRDIFLGTRECQGYVEPCKFRSGSGFYDNYGELSFDFMFHGFDYPDEIGTDKLFARFWRPKMVNGVVNFIRPSECTFKRLVRPMAASHIESVGLREDGLLQNDFEYRGHEK